MIDHSKELDVGTVVCDFCVPPEEIDLNGNWHECIDKLKQLGWTNFKDKVGDWYQKCPSCAKGPTAEEDFK